MKRQFIIAIFVFVSVSAVFAWFSSRRADNENNEVENLLSNATTTPLFLPWRVEIGDEERLARTELTSPWFVYVVGEEGGEFGYQVTKRRNMMTGEEVETVRTERKGELSAVESVSYQDPFEIAVQVTQEVLPEGGLEQAALSPSGDQIAFTYGRDGENANNVLAIIHRDGTGFKKLREGAVRTTPFFSPEGDAVLYIVKVEGNSVLSYYHLPTDRFARMVTLPRDYDEWIPSWTDEELLAMAGIDKVTEDGNTDVIPYRGRLLLIDLKRDTLAYASPILIGGTGFIGFSGFHARD